MAHDTYLIFSFFENNDPISAKSASEIVFKYHMDFPSSESFNNWFMYFKTYRPYLLMLFDIDHTYNF